MLNGLRSSTVEGYWYNSIFLQYLRRKIIYLLDESLVEYKYFKPVGNSESVSLTVTHRKYSKVL
jgi:hypothetical protein